MPETTPPTDLFVETVCEAFRNRLTDHLGDFDDALSVETLRAAAEAAADRVAAEMYADDSGSGEGDGSDPLAEVDALLGERDDWADQTRRRLLRDPAWFRAASEGQS